MSNSSIPFNITLLNLTPQITSSIRKVSALDVFESTTKNFHNDGLYSVDTFGNIGTDVRYKKYGYIDLKITIFHPIIYKAIVSMKSLYGDIMSSKEFVIWDEATSSFVKSNALEGQTGFEYFCEHWQKIQFENTQSIIREQNIAMIDKFKQICLTDKIIVMPAAYRDLEVDPSGRETSDDINSLYYKLIAISNTINPSTVKISPESYNSQRMSLQRVFNEIYDYILKIIEGKKNLFMGKWASRKIFNGTRNVITSMDTTVHNLDDPNNIGMNHTVVGLYQLIKGILPITKFHLKNGFLSTVFDSNNGTALLTMKNTLQSTRANVSNTAYNKWMTSEGIESIISSYSDKDVRRELIDVEGHYLGLVYIGADNTFRLIHGIDELPAGRDPKDCRPLDLLHLIYCSIYQVANKYPGFVTRFPIAGPGSIYASNTYLKPTVKTKRMSPLDNDWEISQTEPLATEFPTDSGDYNALSPHPSRLVGLAGDGIR